MAAALHAYDDHEDQFDRIAEKVPPKVDRGEVTASVVAGDHTVETALAALSDDEETDEEETEHAPRELTAEEKRIKQLESQVERLEEHVEELEDTIEQKEGRIGQLKGDLEAAKSEERKEVRERREVSRLERENDRLERELDERDERIEELEGKLARLKELWKLDHSNFADVSEKKAGLTPVKPVAKFTKGAIQSAHESFGLATDDVVYLRDASGAGRSTAERLADVDPKVVLVGEGGLSDAADRVLFENEIPVGPADDVTIQEVDELAVARESEVEAVVEDWEDRAEERRKEQKAEQLDRLISEHRADRQYDSGSSSSEASGQSP
jgi:predicted RNase H-like nuclease (RuvC/YqgF family)